MTMTNGDRAYQMMEDIARRHEVPRPPDDGYEIQDAYGSRETVMNAADLVTEASVSPDAEIMRELADQVTARSLPAADLAAMDTQSFRRVSDVEMGAPGGIGAELCGPAPEGM